MLHIRLYKTLHAARGQMALDVDLTIEPGAFVAITGPSGSGKTTLLRLIAGLARPERGFIRFADRTWLDTGQPAWVSPQQRRVGLVFQDYALFPNLTVRRNLTYGLERGQDPAIIDELVSIMELEELVDRYPATLSGGQQQRVALARALVRRPDLLLLDEPLSALDPELRGRLQQYLRRVHDRYRLTTLLVSHDDEEVRRLADRIVRLVDGRIAWQGTPDELPPGGAARIAFQGELRHVETAGELARVSIRVGTAEIALTVPADRLGALRVGEQVTVQVLSGDIVLQPRSDERTNTPYSQE